MSNTTQSLAGTRITSLLDANSFVEIGQSVTARNTDFNMTEKKAADHYPEQTMLKKVPSPRHCAPFPAFPIQ